MANYTIELYKIVRSNIDIFPKEYNFYNEENKKAFEEKFIRHFFFREIGFETVERFKFHLETKLNEIYPYYSHLYKTSIYDYNPILNYDVDEEITREVEGTSSMNASSRGSGNNKQFDTPITKNNNYKNSPSFINDISDSSEQQGNSNNSQLETNKRRTKGNIGVMTTQDLIMKERQIIINIDKLIIEECEDLFMQIY